MERQETQSSKTDSVGEEEGGNRLEEMISSGPYREMSFLHHVSLDTCVRLSRAVTEPADSLPEEIARIVGDVAEWVGHHWDRSSDGTLIGDCMAREEHQWELRHLLKLIDEETHP